MRRTRLSRRTFTTPSASASDTHNNIITNGTATEETPTPLIMTVDPHKRRHPHNQSYRRTQFFDIDIVHIDAKSLSSDKFLSFSVSGGAPVSTLQLPLFDSDDNSSSSWARQKIEDFLWLASALFVLYYGDFRANFFSLLAEDPRIRRTPLHAGLLCIFVLFSWGVANGALLQQLLRLYQIRPTSLMLIRGNESDARDYVSDGGSLMLPVDGLPIPGILAVAAFVWFSFALWPVWKILTLPMLFTLAMASTVVMSYAIPYLNLNLRVDSKP